MRPKSRKLLDDIRDAATFIMEMTREKTLSDYRNERILRQAIERNLEVIGEALNRLSKTDPETASRIQQHELIIAFRNLLIHGYDLIDHQRVWEVIQQHVPNLHENVKALIDDAQDGMLEE